MTAKKTKRKHAEANGSSRKHVKKNGAALRHSIFSIAGSFIGRTGLIIRRWRESKPNPLTREDLAMRMGCCMSTIRNWEDEKGTREPRISQLLKLEEIKPGLIAKLFRQAFRSFSGIADRATWRSGWDAACRRFRISKTRRRHTTNRTFRPARATIN